MSESQVIIVAGDKFYRKDNRVWLPAYEWKSLKQWWDFLDEVVLLKPELESNEIPEGWIEVPIGIKVHRLCNSQDGYFARRRDTIRTACEMLAPPNIMMARMPYYETQWCYQVARKRGMRYFLEIHGDWKTSILEEDSSSLLRKITRWFRATSSKKMLSEMAANAIGVLGVGPQLVEEYVPQNVPSMISTNHLMSQFEYFHREDFFLKDPPRILFVGEMQRRKGLHILFQALSLLKSKGQRFEMIMVGSGPMIRDLKEYALCSGYADSVNFVGNIAHGEELYKYFRGSDVFVLPSVAAEGVPRVTHEAMALGCPVIATDIGSVAWQLQCGAGLVVPPNDAESLAHAISQVLGDVNLRRSLSEKGYFRSLDFTYEKQKKAIADFIKAHLCK